MSLPALCIERPVMTTLMTAAIALVGSVGYFFLPVAALPQVDFPTISVTTSLPGASPSTMAASIATPLEREFSAIAGVDSITSVSGLGIGRITVQFNLNRNSDAAAQDIEAAIANASRKLPAEMTTPPSYRLGRGCLSRQGEHLPHLLHPFERRGILTQPQTHHTVVPIHPRHSTGNRRPTTGSQPAGSGLTRSKERWRRPARPRRLGRSADRERRRLCRRIPSRHGLPATCL